MKKIVFALLIMCTIPAWAIIPATFYKAGDADKVITLNDIEEKLQGIKEFQSDPTKWAIIIAPEKYDETDDVTYSRKSGQAFEEVAKKVLHVSDRRMYTLIGEDATMGKIKNGLDKLLKYVREGDTIYFYYSGHGIPDIETKEPYLLPKDLDPALVTSEPQFKLANIYKILQDSKATKVVAFIDSCFSGATDNKTLFKGVAAPRIKAKSIKVDQTKMVVITAGQDKQFSNMYKEKKMRLFSYFLMKNLVEGKDSIKELFKATKERVESTSFEFGDQYYQSPTIEGNVEMLF